MSNTPKFVHGSGSGYFPFCVADITGQDPLADYVDNLSAAQVMAFYWSLETFTITFSGTATNGTGTTNAAGNLILNPISSTLWNQGTADGGWYQVGSTTSLGSWPAIHIPKERVCNNVSFQRLAQISGNLSTHTGNTFTFTFWVGTDPNNAGQYRLYYEFFTRTQTANSYPVIDFFNPNRSTEVSRYTGTISIGGITMNWIASDNFSSTSRTAIAMSATSSNYTYV